MGKKIQYIGRYNMDGVLLGKGNFARVELATHEITEIKVAIKVIDTKKIKEDYIRQNLHREAKIMSQLRHPNIIRLYETLKATTLYCLVLEYAAGGDLLSYIKQQDKSRLSENDARPFVCQLVSALHYLHEKNVVHRDLKMENIMLDEKKKSIKLIDFGLSKVWKADEPLRTHCGSPEYAAPELFLVGKTYGPEVDIWSLGIITYAIMIGKLPFFTPYKDEYQRQRMLQQIQKGLSQYNEREMQILSAECRNLLHQVLESNPEARIPLSEIEIHPWLTKNGKYLFTPYVPLPKDKQLRHVCTSELAIMTGIKRMMVEEQVKEHKADELSAMFNMLMYKKQRERGLFDGDHTCKKAKRERDSRSRSREREKIRLKTPDSAKGKEIRGKVAGKKTATKSILNSVQRPNSLETTAEGRDEQAKRVTVNNDRLVIDAHERAADSHHALAPNHLGTAMLRAPHHFPHTKQTGSGLNTLSVPRLGGDVSSVDGATKTSSQVVNGPVTRIPLSQRRVPPAKLNMTLDLSVTQLSNIHTQAWRVKNASAAEAANEADTASVTSSGYAASSGVRPKISTSPKETKESKLPVTSPIRKDPYGVRTPCSPPVPSDKKASRPSTLRYLMTGIEKVRRRLPSSDSHKQAPDESTGIEVKGEEREEEGNSDWLKAPKATPEDSMIDSYSSPSPDDSWRERSGHRTHLDCIVESTAQVETVVDKDKTCPKSLLSATSGGEHRHSVMFQTEYESVPMQNEQSKHVEHSKTGILKHCKSKYIDNSCMKDVELTAQKLFLDKGLKPSDVKCKDVEKVKRLSFELQDEPPSYESLTSSQLSKSSQNSMGSCPAYHAPHHLDSGSGSSLPLRFQAKNTSVHLDTLPTSGSEPLVLGSSVCADVAEGPRTLSLSNPSKLDNTHVGCQACGLSPGSPTYYERHSKFCHTGAHALDVFFSPDEVPSPVGGAFWKPAYSYVSHGSPTHTSPTHVQTLASGCYHLPRVGADTPRIPMQTPIASAEVFGQSRPPLSYGDAEENPYGLSQPVTKQSCSNPAYTCGVLTAPVDAPMCGHHAVCKASPGAQPARACGTDKRGCGGAVYSPVPDTSLRLEPVGGSSESLAMRDEGESRRVQGDGCTDKCAPTQCNTHTSKQSEPELAVQDPAMQMKSASDISLECNKLSKCQQSKPSCLVASLSGKTARMFNLLHRERHSKSSKDQGNNGHQFGIQGNSIPPSARQNKLSDSPKSLPSTPERKSERNKFLRLYDLRGHHYSWRHGISHLLRLKRSNSQSMTNHVSTLNHKQVHSTANNTNGNSRIVQDGGKVTCIGRNGEPVVKSSRCNSIDAAYYKELDALWTAPASPKMLMKTASLELDSCRVPIHKPPIATAMYELTSSVVMHPELPVCSCQGNSLVTCAHCQCLQENTLATDSSASKRHKAFAKKDSSPNKLMSVSNNINATLAVSAPMVPQNP